MPFDGVGSRGAGAYVDLLAAHEINSRDDTLEALDDMLETFSAQ